MRTTNRVAMIVCTAALLAACGSEEEPAAAEPMPVDQTALGDMVGTIDKARAVEDTSKQRMDQLNDALENSEAR